jgi:predicted porin
MPRALSVTILALLATAAPAGAEIDEVLESFEVYGSLRGHVAGFDGETEIQDNGSRLGVRFSREFGQRIGVLAGAEWSLNLFDSDFSFNLDSSTDSDFSSVDRTGAGDTFGTRLGYLGVDFGNVGRVTIGKQWSAYRDVSKWTDNFDVFGKEASFTFPAGTDGGELGTGRAEKSLLYRTDIGRLQVGAQVQLDASDVSSAVSKDTYGFSLRYGLTERLSIGAAYNDADLDDESIVVGLIDDPEYLIFGVRYETERLYLAAIWADQENGDFVDVDDPMALAPVSVAFDASGVELYGSYDVTERFRLTGGLNVTDPDRLDPLVDPDYEIKYYVVGARWHFDRRTWAYFEARLDDSVDPSGESAFDVVTLGLRFDFSLKKKAE